MEDIQFMQLAIALAKKGKGHVNPNPLVGAVLVKDGTLILIPGCFLAGAVITLFCDGIARTVFAPMEISISSVTAVFLVPVVIVAMLRKQNR